MNQQRFFAVLTFLFLGGTLAVIAIEKVYDGDWNAVLKNRGVPTAIADTAALQDVKIAEHAQASKISMVSPDEVRNKIAAIPKIHQIPWTAKELETAFNNAVDRQCQLLPSNVFVEPIEPDLSSTSDLKRYRKSAFTVGLQVAPEHRNELPSVSKATIESYLADHVLAIQPTLIQDASGALFFEGTIQAAFYPSKSPSITVPSQPMISEAVQGFRVIGFFEDDNIEGTTGKTLVLAFRYIRELSAGGVTLTPQTEFEVLILHLPQVTSGPPLMLAFSTADARSQFEELDMGQASAPGNVTILGNIRFQKFTNGIFPASPVVLGVQNRALSRMALSEMIQKMAGGPGGVPLKFTEMLSQIHENPKLTASFAREEPVREPVRNLPPQNDERRAVPDAKPDEPLPLQSLPFPTMQPLQFESLGNGT